MKLKGTQNKCYSYKFFNIFLPSPKIRTHEDFIFIVLFTIYATQGTTVLFFTLYIYIYTGCPRRNVPDFGRVFLMLKYTDITQNTHVQS